MTSNKKRRAKPNTSRWLRLLGNGLDEPKIEYSDIGEIYLWVFENGYTVRATIDDTTVFMQRVNTSNECVDEQDAFTLLQIKKMETFLLQSKQRKAVD